MQDREAQAKVNRLALEARDHKRASNREKKKARLKLQQLDEFIAACTAAGIKVTINQHAVQGGHGATGNTQPHARQDAPVNERREARVSEPAAH